jgi:hypothetical protein
MDAMKADSAFDLSNIDAIDPIVTRDVIVRVWSEKTGV